MADRSNNFWVGPTVFLESQGAAKPWTLNNSLATCILSGLLRHFVALLTIKIFA